MDKKTIAVIFGGCSTEYEVSLQSACSVLANLDAEKYEAVKIGITRQGDWYRYNGGIAQIQNDSWHRDGGNLIPAAVSQSRTRPGLLELRPEGIKRIRLELAFPVLHGKNGEDGTVQGLFELAGIPLVGCGVLASALCMDKDRARKLAQAAGVTIPSSTVLTKENSTEDAFDCADKLGYPLFVKPLRAGSSYGITKVTGRDELPTAIRLAFEFDSHIILEEAISGFEVGCAVLGNDTLTVGEPDEIELADGFFNFTEKYTLKTSAIHVPARIPTIKAAEMKETAQRIYKALGCQGFARVDMFLDSSGRVVFNEVNTIPGFTAHSRYPSMMKAIGMSFEQVISNVIELAVSK